MEQLCTQLNSNRTVWICIAIASYFSTVCDPWVYAIRMPEFRVALKELFHCSRRRARSKKLVRMAETAKKKKKKCKSVKYMQVELSKEDMSNQRRD